MGVMIVLEGYRDGEVVEGVGRKYIKVVLRGFTFTRIKYL